MKKKSSIRFYCLVICLMYGRKVTGSELDLTYTTEVQTNFRKEGKWVNLLRLDYSCPLGRNFRFSFSSISIAETRQDALVDDMQGFSNIEEKNLPFAPAVLGLEYRTSRSSLFLGVRNVNEDYFTSPCSSFFTNSSCGIYPTLSANYPLAAVGLDYRLTSGPWEMELSVYNGTAQCSLTGAHSVFRVCPDTDGVLGLSSVNYRKNDSEYSMGAGIHRGMCVGDETGVEEAVASPLQKRMTCVLWACAEQRVCRRGYALLQGSVRPSVEGGCRNYAGAGGVVKYDKVSFGFFLDYADYTTAHEWAGEVTCRWACTSRVTVQPAIHLIRNSNGNYAAGLLRMYYVW